MKAYTPRTFRTGGIVDVEDVNANLLHLARDIRRSQDRRYTYSTVTIPLDGLVNTDTAAERTVPLPRPNDGVDTFTVDVVGVELSLYTADTETWTLSTTDELGAVLALEVDGTGVVTTEAYGATSRPLMLKTVDELLFVLSASGASTIVRGVLVLHLRCDRWVQNSGTRTPYTPTLLNASTADQAAAINAQMALAEAAVADDEASGSNLEMRCACFAVNDLATSMVARFMSGVGSAFSEHLYIVGAAGRTVKARFNVGTGPSFRDIDLSTVDANTIVDDRIQVQTTKTDNPTFDGDDYTITLSQTGGAISRAFAFIWWI